MAELVRQLPEANVIMAETGHFIPTDDPTDDPDAVVDAVLRALRWQYRAPASGAGC